MSERSTLTRRRLLALGGLAPIALAAAALAPALRAGTDLLRPPGRGTSAALCGACGATGHTMLDPGCPRAPRLARAGRASLRGPRS